MKIFNTTFSKDVRLKILDFDEYLKSFKTSKYNI